MIFNIRSRIFLILSFLAISYTSSPQDLMVPGQYAWLYKAQYPYYNEKSDQNFESIPNVVTVDFQFHQGNAILTDGRRLSGWFKFASFKIKPSIPEGTILKQPDNISYKPYISDAKAETIDEDKFLRLALAGKDSDVLTEVDSTIFLKVGSDFLRLKIDSPIKLYDNLRIVDELQKGNFCFWIQMISSSRNRTGMTQSAYGYKSAKPYMDFIDATVHRQLRYSDHIFYENKGDAKRIKEWDDIPASFDVDPLIKKIGELGSRNSPQDINFALTFSFAKDKKGLIPSLDSIEVDLKSGKKITGLGLIIPAGSVIKDITDRVVFFDGKKFFLFNFEEISAITFKNKELKPVVVKFLNRRFFAYQWQYKGQVYYISDEFYAGTNYFNLEGRPSFAILQEKSNGYYKLIDDNKIEKVLLDEMMPSLQRD